MYHEDQPEIPPFTTLDYSSSYLYSSLAMSCPAITGKNGITINIDREYSDYYGKCVLDFIYYTEGCYCIENYYRLPNNTCAPCIAHGVCPGGEKQNTIIVPAGYYPFPNASNIEVLVACSDTAPGKNPCNPSSSEVFTCEVGYESRLCSRLFSIINLVIYVRCSSGYFKLGSRCSLCNWFFHYGMPVLIALSIITALVYIFIFRAYTATTATIGAIPSVRV